MTGGRRPLRGDRGVGVVSAVAGVTVFLAFLLFAVQLLTNLYATSVVTSAAYDGARLAAEHDRDHLDAAVQAELTDHIRDLLGAYGDRVEVDWDGSTTEQVRVRVAADNPSFLLRSLGGHLPFTHIDRTVTVRVEQLQ